MGDNGFLIHRFGGITTRILAILALAFSLIILIVYLIVETQAKPRISELSAQGIIETGNEIIGNVASDINHVDGIAKATSALSGGLPKDTQVYQEAIGNLMQNADKNIISGGVWFDPNMFVPGQEKQAFVWHRDNSGVMKNIDSYNSETTATNPYYRDWWYIPTMYARHDHCVWSRAYVDPISNKPMMTCAKAMYNSKNKAFDGVVSFNILLDNLDTIMKQWQEKIGGYVFLVDLDNRFLTFPDKALVTQATSENPQGELITVAEFAKQQVAFAPIAKSLHSINEQLISQAIAIDEPRYDLAAGSILSTTNLNKISEQESKLLSALLLVNVDKSLGAVDTHFVETVAVPNDAILNQDSTAFVFKMPLTYWKMVIVKPNSDMMTLANTLATQLVLTMLLAFLPILLLTAWAFRNFFSRPLRNMANSVATMGDLIGQKKYHQLPAHKLPPSNVNEIQTISHQTNQLVDKVIENEGALAEVNVYLEKKVIERTKDLQTAINQLKASQVQLVRSEKMATLGQMVAGVAHEVNTPLGYVRSNMELVGENLSRFDELIAHTEHLLTTLQDNNATTAQIDNAIAQTLKCCHEMKEDEVSSDLADLVKDGLFGVDQISELVVNLRDFSRVDEAKVKNVDINDCIHSSLMMARNSLKTVEVTTELAKLPHVKCNPSQINQVLLNLFNNAAQAIPDGTKGKLHIASTLIESAVAGDEMVSICVTDNGMGIEDSVLDKMFEPFFTTKKAGEGTGLGLAIASQIIEQHGGTIEATSQVGIGTTFIIKLPVQQDDKRKVPSDIKLFETD